MFGGDLAETDHYVIVPYWVDAYTVTMYLIDSTIPPPEQPSTVFDLLEDWSVTSGTLQEVGNHWDNSLSLVDEMFYQSVVWGRYEGGGPPQLLIGAIASWGHSPDEHLRGNLDVFIPLVSETEIAHWRTIVYPSIADWSLEQVANMLAEQLAGLGMTPDESVIDSCGGDKPGDEGLNQMAVHPCLPPPVAVTSMHPCHAAFKGCFAVADLRRAAAYSTCDSNRFYGDVAMVACIAIPLPTSIACAAIYRYIDLQCV